MRPSPQPPDLDPEFLHAYEQERLRWLRVRFLWFSGSFGTLWTLAALIVTPTVVLDLPGRPDNVGGAVIVASVLKATLFLHPFLVVLRSGPLPRQRVLTFVYRMILLYSIIQILPAKGFAHLVNNSLHAANIGVTVGPMMPILTQTLLIHLIASLLIPWTPREAIRPLIPFGCVFLALALLGLARGDSDLVMTLIAASMVLLVPLPGLAVCALRQSRFMRRFRENAIIARYGELRHELATARRIHDRIFPEPITTGPVLLDYVYEPMRQIGGDFLFVGSDPTRAPDGDAPLSILLIDVTGHGIAAALAVNRLHGELARIFGSEADASPGRVLAELNRYIHLTMSRDTVFATAVCLRIDPSRDELRWASAGHPPVFVRRADGPPATLDATTFLLGAADPDEFDATELTVPFGPGDAALAYTDGAVEARRRGGGMIGLDGLAAIADRTRRPDASGWAAAVLEAVTNLRDGPAEDDTLVVRVSRAASPAPARPAPRPGTADTGLPAAAPARP